MVALGDADALLSGSDDALPRDDAAGAAGDRRAPEGGLVSGIYMLVFEKHVIFCGDTTVNIDPTAEQLAQIAYAAARIVRTFGIVPRDRDAVVLQLRLGAASGSREGGAGGGADAQRDPSLMSTARCRRTPRSTRRSSPAYPFSRSRSRERADLPQPQRRQHRVQVVATHLGGATAIGPILVGMQAPVHVLEQGADVEEIVNMAAVAVIDAQERSGGAGARRDCGPLEPHLAGTHSRAGGR
jgi:malate dehydrogenase (oxaloacetate-decarboxylating)(NADP+)